MQYSFLDCRLRVQVFLFVCLVSDPLSMSFVLSVYCHSLF